MSAQAAIAGYVPGYPEFLELTYTPPGFSSSVSTSWRLLLVHCYMN